MKKFTFAAILMAVILFFGGGINAFGESNSDKTIVLLTNPVNGNDLAQYNWLLANGFNVTSIDVQSPAKTGDVDAPTPEFRAILDAADLVIVGRNAHLNGFGVLDEILTPVITGNAFGARWSDPKLWFSSPDIDMNVVSGKNVWIHVANDPIFANSHVVGDSINFTRLTGFITKYGVHNGTVIGDYRGDIGIVRFAKDVPYNGAVGAITPKSDHTVFSFNEDGGKALSLNLDGQAAYYGEIRRLMGMSIEAPVAYSGNPADRSLVLLTDPAHGGDLALNTFLTNNGLKVTTINVTDAMIGTPTPAFQAQLDAADVIVYGRDAWSNVQNAIDATITPVIQTNTFGAQWGSPDKFWFLNASMNVQSNPEFFKIQVTADPIFANSHIAGGEMAYATEAAFVTTTDAHNGTVIGNFGGDAGIVRFAKNVPYNSDPAAKTPKSDHTLFPFQTGPSSMTLSPDAQAAFYAEVCRMAGLPITAPTYYYLNNGLKNIILLTDDAHGGDFALLTFLKGNGFSVTKRLIDDALIADPTPEFMDTLNSADLVVYGRDAWSNVQNAVDSTTTPVIHANPYGAQWAAPDKFWFLDALMNTVTENIWLKVASDPIFAYSNVVGDSINYASGAAFVVTSEPHNGAVIGTYGSANDIGIVRFTKNIPYNSSPSAKIPHSDHTIFPFQTSPHAMTLTHDGQAAYYAEMLRLMGSPIQAPLYYYDNPSSVSSLSSLVPSAGLLSPVFSSTETLYSLVVPEGTTSVTLTVTTTDPKATVVGDGVITGIPTAVFITVTAEDGISLTDYAVDITTNVGIKEFSKAGISIYPNPARNNVSVDGLAPGARVNIMNVNGQVVSRTVADSKNIQLNLGQLKSGIYLMKVEIDGKYYSARFIKQ